MADPIIRTKQTLDNTQFKKGLKESQSITGQFKKSLMAMGPAIAAAFSVGAIVDFGKAAIAAMDAQEKANAKLYTALKGNASATNELINQANELAAITLFQDEDIVNAQALLALFIKDKDAIKQLTPLVLDFAQATGKSLEESAKAVSKAFAGESKTIKGTSIEMTGAAGSAERLTSLTNELTKAVEGQAEIAASTGAASIQQLGKAWGEFAESIGYLVAPSLSKLAKGLTDATQAATTLTSSKSLSFWDKVKIALGASVRDTRMVAETFAENYDPALEQAEFTAQQFTETIEDNSEALAEQAKEAEQAAKKIRSLDEESMKRITGGISPITTGELTESGALTGNQAAILGAMEQVGGSRISGMQLPTEPLKEFDATLRNSMEGMSAFTDKYVTWSEKTIEVNEMMVNSFQQLSSGMVQAMSNALQVWIEGGDGLSALFGGILGSVADFLKGLGEAMMASGTAGLAMKALSVNPALAIAAGIALQLAAGVVEGMMNKGFKMASGGIIPSGFPNDTYPAMLSSGETVIPAPHKLQGALGGGITLNGKFRIQGSDLMYIIEKETSKKSRYQ